MSRTASRLSVLLAVAYVAAAASAAAAHAQPQACSLGAVKERVAPEYPMQLQGRIVEGTVQLLTTFAPDGRVTASKVLSGPSALRFSAESYVHGWRADKSDEPRQCAIGIDFRFDGSRASCSSRMQVQARAERLDDTHVLVHLSCDTW